MTVKSINDTVEFNDLVPTLLVFEAYSKMYAFDFLSSLITQKFITIQKIMKKIKKIKAERQVSDTVNIRNGLIVNFFHDLPFNSDVLIGREKNAGRADKGTKSFKLLEIEGETCKIELFSGFTKFRSIIVKLYFTDFEKNENEIDERMPTPVSFEIEKENEQKEQFS